MTTSYRFLPWTRRGLSAALPDGGPDGGNLDQRPLIDVKVAVAGAGEANPKARLNGPGDVIGIDPHQIVRTYPQAYTTNAEPNYLAAVDFDAPELPWLFTPRGVPASGHLPPWVVLVVVEDRDGVSITVPPGAPLPQLAIRSGATHELPDLAESWAWAHVQLVETTGAPAGDVSHRLADEPNRTVGRLLCPRRLSPQRRWMAAVVPAFDVGRVRGLGGTPAPDAKVGPAWASGEDRVTLPVYFHWEFQTGVEGDFESLAQRLKPHKAAVTVGLVPMHVGDGAPPIRVPQNQDRHLDMDGALRAPAQSDGRIDEVPAALRSGLKEVTRTLADGADGVLDGQALVDASRQPVGPPVYASSHVRRWKVLDQQNPQDAEWFRELNLDPRPRVAAGLGAECVRVNQEKIVNAAWQQVGDVLAAEAALQRAALGKIVSASFFRRHLEAMADPVLLTFTAPLAGRLPMDGASLAARVAATSLPDAVLDPGLRRALAPAGRAVARAAKRAEVPVVDVRPGLVGKLAAGRPDLDATSFARPALTGAGAALKGRTFAGIGLPVSASTDEVSRLAESARRVEAAAAALGTGDRLAVRDDVRRGGMAGQAHVDAARRLAQRSAAQVATAIGNGAKPDTPTVAAVSAASLLDGALQGAREGGPITGGVGLLVEAPTLRARTARLDDAAQVDVAVLDVDADHTLVVRTQPGQANIPVAVLDRSLDGADLGAVLGRIGTGGLHLPAPGEVVDRDDLPVLHRTAGSVVVAPGGAVGGVGGAGGVIRRGALPTVLASSMVTAPVTAADGGVRVTRPVTGTPRPPRLPLPTIPTVPTVPATPMHPVPGPVVVPDPVVVPGAQGDDDVHGTVVMPVLVKDVQVIGRLEVALAAQREHTVITTDTPVGTVIAFPLATAASTVLGHAEPVVAQALRRDALLSFAGKLVRELRPKEFAVDGWWATPALDRIMAYPTFPVPASDYLTAYDRTRFCPGVDSIPTDSITLLETNPRFIASFMAGLNHETNRELLWRGYPTDSRGTPFRHFWRRLDGKDDIPPIHGWRTGRLAAQTSDPQGNLVLLVRGELLRRYPNTIVVAMPAITDRQPDRDQVITPIFAGQFDPDVSFFGFPFDDTILEQGQGMFFALMEPVTEPRFGLDQTEGGPSGGGGGTSSDALAWSDTETAEGDYLGLTGLGRIGFQRVAGNADGVAALLFQRPFALYVHAKHLLAPLPVQK